MNMRVNLTVNPPPNFFAVKTNFATLSPFTTDHSNPPDATI